MLFHSHQPLGDAPPGYWQSLAASWRQSLLLILLGTLGAGFAWWTDSPRLQFFASILGGMGLVQLVLGGGVVLWRSQQSRGGN